MARRILVKDLQSTIIDLKDKIAYLDGELKETRQKLIASERDQYFLLHELTKPQNSAASPIASRTSQISDGIKATMNIFDASLGAKSIEVVNRCNPIPVHLL